MAIRADPPGIRPGETSALSILVADPDGLVAAPEVTWELTPNAAGEPPLGSVTVGVDEVTYSAPAAIPEPIFDSVIARVSTPDGEIAALKVIRVGDELRSNPELTALTADGSDLLVDKALALAPGQTVTLSVELDAAMNETAAVAWFSTIGTIEQFRSNPTELVAPDAPGSGSLFVVVRDGLGVAWEAIEITVQ